MKTYSNARNLKIQDSHKKKRLEFIEEVLRSNDHLKLLTSIDSIKDISEKVEFKCSCGNQFSRSFHNLRRQKHKKCKFCASKLGASINLSLKKKKLGKDNPMYNSGFSDKRRKELYAKYRDPKYIEFRKRILERDKYTCKKCKTIAQSVHSKSSLNIHHLFSKLENPRLEYKIFNLMTLCSFCHRLFHKTFGYRNNTPKQMKIYLQEVVA